jgi:hypothetical protein
MLKFLSSVKLDWIEGMLMAFGLLSLQGHQEEVVPN